jgi:hypothetical protein
LGVDRIKNDWIRSFEKIGVGGFGNNLEIDYSNVSATSFYENE